MKKIKTMLTALVLLLATTAFATDGAKVKLKVKAAFQQDFSLATKVRWETASEFYFVSFQWKGVSVDAVYDAEGQLLGRKIDIDQLPAAVSSELTKKYDRFSASASAWELNLDGETSYYLNVQDNKQVLNLRCSVNGEITVEKRTKK